MKPPIVEVDWVDAVTRIETCKLSDVKTSPHTFLVRRTAVGYLVHKDRHRIVLAGDFDLPTPSDDEQEPSVGTFTTLPLGWVEKIKTIKEEEK